LVLELDFGTTPTAAVPESDGRASGLVSAMMPPPQGQESPDQLRQILFRVMFISCTAEP
jgi:hypothetical protein